MILVASDRAFSRVLRRVGRDRSGSRVEEGEENDPVQPLSLQATINLAIAIWMFRVWGVSLHPKEKGSFGGSFAATAAVQGKDLWYAGRTSLR